MKSGITKPATNWYHLLCNHRDLVIGPSETFSSVNYKNTELFPD